MNLVPKDTVSVLKINCKTLHKKEKTTNFQLQLQMYFDSWGLYNLTSIYWQCLFRDSSLSWALQLLFNICFDVNYSWDKDKKHTILKYYHKVKGKIFCFWLDLTDFHYRPKVGLSVVYGSTDIQLWQ